MTSRKQPGRRYGPAPKNPPHEGMQAPKPMEPDRRSDVYGRHWTARQQRQFARMHNIYGFNGDATPKQKKVRR